MNTKNLEALGAQRLAELLVEVSTANAAVKRRLRNWPVLKVQKKSQRRFANG